MKAIFDKENWKITLDTDAVKAIRFVNGFNTDLRVSLTSINRDWLWSWLDGNRVELFGADLATRPDPASEDWDKYERMLDGVVRQIVR